MTIIPCNYTDHAEAILALFNDAILNTTALFVYEPRTLNFMEEWFAAKEQAQIPVLGAVDEQGELLGFASYGPFRPQAAYKYTVEHSVYIAKTHCGKGIGSRLMEELIECAQEQQYHALIGALDAGNAGSIALHLKLGFKHVGTVKESAYKFGKWRDMALYQLTLSTPAMPCDG
jgi:phosphinothricin acetyltransferase